MVDLTRILAAPDISTLRDAVAKAFEELSQEQTNAEKIAILESCVDDIDARLKVVEAKP